MRARLEILSLILLLASFGAACTATTGSTAGFETYEGVEPKARYSYAFPDDAAPRLGELLKLSINHWNQALGSEALRLARGYDSADVKVLYKDVNELPAHPARTRLLGCMPGYRPLADCVVEIEVPRALTSAEDMAKVAHLFQQGSLDAQLYATREYQDVSDYLKDKLVLLGLVHEIGHTLGLAHAKDPGCVMAEVPDGELSFCAAELAAARGKLDAR